MTMGSYKKCTKVGLQLKSVLVLTFVIVCVTAAGGWFYFDATRSWLRHSDLRQAARMSQALSLAAEEDLRTNKSIPLQRLASDFVRNDDVYYVAVLDKDGNVLASASRDDNSRWPGLVNLPVSVSSVEQRDDMVLLASPVIGRTHDGGNNCVLGGVRLVLRSCTTRASLANVQRRMGIIAAAIILCATPLAYVLIWRILIQPFRKLLATTRRLAGGDWSARTHITRNDEIGELARSFDSMTDELAASRDNLMVANELLEKKVHDRTAELQMSNRRLRDEMGEKEDFLRAVSHDLNAPLRNIAGMATIILMKWRDQLPEEVVSRLQRVQANVDVCSGLISELLQLSHIRTRPEKREVVDMGELLAEVVGTFECEAGSRGIELFLKDGMPKLYVEKNRIRQVFQNLVENAIKYMKRRKDGRVEIGYENPDGYHRFYVADNGPGIPQDQHQKIFYVFRRGDSPDVAEVEGKGVGLAVVRSIVSNYDGRTWVQSEPGHGATFFVELDSRCTQPPAECGESGTPGTDSETVARNSGEVS